uniref:pseudouridine 5'-phosphatase n=1 Tax=Culicoides sonorensis TaxID=179676 RepID=A0A336MMC7_CULSO
MFSFLGKMAKLRPVKAVIFDMDGLILDTEKVYQTVFADICKKYNKPFPIQTRLKVLGTTERKSCAITVEDCQLPCTVDDFVKDYKTLSLQRLGNCDILRGAERLIRHLHDNDVPIALATSSGEDSVKVKTKNHQELFQLFHHKVMGSSDPEVKEGKPAPDIFLIAAQRFKEKVEPEECLVFEDAPNGVTAARAAGMQCVMVPDEKTSEELCQEATLVLKSLEDFKPEEFGLPPFKL